MTLQTSGAISLADLQTEYGGANPISISEYYRNGSYVPNSITTSTVVREPSTGYSYSLAPPYYYWMRQATTPNRFYVYWNGTAILSAWEAPSGLSNWTSGGWTYYKGPNLKYSSYGVNFYNDIYRQQGGTSTTNVNQSVPTSGTVSLSNYYGGRKT